MFSGGQGVAGSNPVSPTTWAVGKTDCRTVKNGKGTCFKQVPFPFLRLWDRTRVRLAESERSQGREHECARLSGAFGCPGVAWSVPGMPTAGVVRELFVSGLDGVAGVVVEGLLLFAAVVEYRPWSFRRRRRISPLSCSSSQHCGMPAC